MKPSLNSKPNLKKKQPDYANTPEEQTMLYWRLQQQRNDRHIPGYTWNVRDSLQTLNRIGENYALPMALRTAAAALRDEIIVAARPKRVNKQRQTPELLILNLTF